MTPTRPHVHLALLASVLSIASCGGGGSSGGTTPNAPKPALQQAASASGDGQTGTVGAALALPLRVFVTLGGSPLRGDTVTWSASGASGSLSPAQSLTDASGIATATWTLGQTAGSQGATATSAGATGSPVTFSATATAGAAAQMALAGGDGQVGAPNSTTLNPLAVRVTDAFANAVSGTTVSWAVVSGPATVSPTSAATDATGSARTTVQFGSTTGPVVLTASAAGLTGSPVTFHETSAVPSAAAVSIGDNFFKSGQNGTQNPAVDTLAVGVTVTWTWTGTANHSVESLGSPSFASSVVKSSGTYAVTFGTAGTYNYDCSVHGSAMTGTIVIR